MVIEATEVVEAIEVAEVPDAKKITQYIFKVHAGFDFFRPITAQTFWNDFT